MPEIKKPKIFISYSHEDEKWKDFIKLKLKALDCFDIWHDRDLRLGEEWFEKIKEETYKTDIVVMLVSDNFLTSDFIANEEIPVFVERTKKESIMLVPLIISHCQWEEYNWFSSRQGYPIDNKPLDSFQVQHHLTFNKCPKINEQATLLAKRIKQEYFDDNKKVITEIEDDLSKIVSFLIKSKITLQTLKSTAKQYLQPIYQRELESKTTLKDIIDHLDNHDKNPLYCVVKELFKDDDEFIKQWLENNKHNNCQKVTIASEDKTLEDSIVVDFETVAGKKNRYNVYIKYFLNGMFQSNDEEVFSEISIDETFKQDFVNYLYSDIKNIDNLEIFLPKELLLLDIKQWNSDKRNRLTRKYNVNIHLRDRATSREKYKENLLIKWNQQITKFQNQTIKTALKEMTNSDDETTKDTKEIGIWYLYKPTVDIFYDDNLFTFISVRGDDLDSIRILWDTIKGTMKLQGLKNYIDHDDRKDITLIWDDPNIPLKPTQGIKP